jgi:peptide/nickel transport system ATP-binding protein
MNGPLLKIDHVRKYYPVRSAFLGVSGYVKAVDDVSFVLKEGETLGLVGESGCGKSTLGRTILRLEQPTAGSVIFNDIDLADLRPAELRKLRSRMQIIFQDPMESLNPRLTIRQILMEPYRIHRVFKGKDRAAKLHEAMSGLLKSVGLSEEHLNRYPHEFSGGQRQRIGIARAIALKPDLIICDEPVSALDVSVQSQILNLLADLKKDLKLTYIFVAHNLAVVRYISDRIAVMYLGKIAEITDAESIYARPLHPYTQALIAAIPEPDPLKRKTMKPIEGDVPSPIAPPPGCAFHPRCPYAEDRCRTVIPALRQVGPGAREHLAACHFAEKFV